MHYDDEWPKENWRTTHKHSANIFLPEYAFLLSCFLCSFSSSLDWNERITFWNRWLYTNHKCLNSELNIYYIRILDGIYSKIEKIKEKKTKRIELNSKDQNSLNGDENYLKWVTLWNTQALKSGFTLNDRMNKLESILYDYKSYENTKLCALSFKVQLLFCLISDFGPSSFCLFFILQ